MARKLIRQPDVERIVGLKKSRIREMIQEGIFPSPIKIGGATLWVEEEVSNFVEAQISAHRGERKVA